MPITLGLIFLLLYLNFNTVAETFIVILSIPFALVGGIWLLYLLVGGLHRRALDGADHRPGRLRSDPRRGMRDLLGEEGRANDSSVNALRSN